MFYFLVEIFHLSKHKKRKRSCKEEEKVIQNRKMQKKIFLMILLPFIHFLSLSFHIIYVCMCRDSLKYVCGQPTPLIKTNFLWLDGWKFKCGKIKAATESSDAPRTFKKLYPFLHLYWCACHSRSHFLFGFGGEGEKVISKNAWRWCEDTKLVC